LKIDERGEVYKEKRRGPRTEPWGTPVRTGDGGVVEESMMTDWEREER
jgi:hypothetical protein